MVGVSESLAGRVAALNLLPFNFAEASIQSTLDAAQRIWEGFYPEPSLEPAKRDLWLSSYVQTHLEGDVRQLQTIRDLRSFETFLSLAASLHGQTVNLAQLGRDVGASQPTVKSWMGILEATYVVYQLPPYFKSFDKRLVRSPKLTFLDPAIVCFLTRQPSADSAIAGAMGGALFERMMVSEACKVFANRGQRPDLYLWRSHDGLEVDLLVRSGAGLHPVEIKLTGTPRLEHCPRLDRSRTLVSSDAARSGVVVCRVPEAQHLPGGHLALPWQEFPTWLSHALGE